MKRERGGERRKEEREGEVPLSVARRREVTELFSVAIISPSRAREEGEDEERGEEFSLRFPRDGSNFRLQEMLGKRRREAEEKKENVGERERESRRKEGERLLSREKNFCCERGERWRERKERGKREE